jgi:hypothetical protein
MPKVISCGIDVWLLIKGAEPLLLSIQMTLCVNADETCQLELDPKEPDSPTVERAFSNLKANTLPLKVSVCAIFFLPLST